MATRPGRIVEIDSGADRAAARPRSATLTPEFIAIKERCLELLTAGHDYSLRTRRPDMTIQDTSRSRIEHRRRRVSDGAPAHSSVRQDDSPPAGAERLAAPGHHRRAGRHPGRLIVACGRSRPTAAGSTASSGRSRARSLQTLIKFFTDGDAWTDIGFTFRSTIFGFLIGTAAGSMLGLSFWWSRNYAAIAQPYVICFESLPKLALAPLVILVFGMGLASKVAIATALTLIVSTLTDLCRRQGGRSGSGKPVLFARRQPPAGIPQADRAVLPAVDHLGAAREYRACAHRRHRRRIHRLTARARPTNPLCRPDL